jgi:aerobic carbon-monoxide dehydrogenase medium subunit
MYPAPFEYHRAATTEEAIGLLTRYGEDAKLLAGGHSLLPLLKLRFAQPKHLIDVGRIPGLSGIQQIGNAIVIGATTTHADLARSPVIRAALPVLSEAANQIGDPQVRNVGTIGGSLAHADPSADLPAVMLALDATISARGPRGERTIPVSEFFVDLLTTALAPDEVLTSVRLAIPPDAAGSAYEKYPHPASRYAVVGVAAVVGVTRERVSYVRVAVTGVGTKAVRAKGVEEMLMGKAPDAATCEAAATRVTDGIDLRSDLQGSEEYKASLAHTYTRRALMRAAAGHKGGAGG